MLGLMQDRPLMIASLIEYASAFHGDTEIVSRLPEGHVRRSTWRQVGEVSKQVANALTEYGVQQGDRIATLAWNSDRHLALYFGVSGTGAVMHTVNPRLFPEQIAYIINHAEDRILFFDITFAPLVSRLAAELATVQTYVVMTDREHMPDVPGVPEGRCCAGTSSSAGSPRTTTGPSSTRTAPRRCATPPGPPAIRKAFSTRIVRRCCTR